MTNRRTLAPFSLCLLGGGLCYVWKAMASSYLFESQYAYARVIVSLLVVLLWRFMPFKRRGVLLWILAILGVAATIFVMTPDFLPLPISMTRGIASAAVLGIEALFLIVWVELYATCGIYKASFMIAGTYVAGPVVFFVVRLLPAVYQMGITLTLPLATVGCLLGSHLILRASPGYRMYDWGKVAAGTKGYQNARRFPWDEIPWRMLLCVCAYMFAFAVNRGFADTETNLTALCLTGVVLLAIITLAPRRFSAYSLYRVVFPVMMVGLLLALIFGAHSLAAQIIINACGTVAVCILTAYLCDKAYRFDLPAIRLYAFCNLLIGLAFLIGILAITWGMGVELPGLSGEVLVYGISIAVVVIAMSIWFIPHDYSRDFSLVDSIREDRQDVQVSGDIADDARKAELITEMIRKRASEVGSQYGLSPREEQVFELLARGRTAARIEEELVLSRSTVKTHIQRIYAKLGIHSRDELLKLLDLPL